MKNLVCLFLFVFLLAGCGTTVVKEPVKPAVSYEEMQKNIVNPDNWHIAIYNGIEFTIYVGPGQVISQKWANYNPNYAPQVKNTKPKVETSPVKKEDKKPEAKPEVKTDLKK